MMKQIPNYFTLLNLVLGCLAIVFTLQNGIMITVDSAGTELLYIPERIWLASLFIGLAALVDFLDGFVARLFRASSEMGKQLDSLADVVSFGVAPGMILFQFLRIALARDTGAIDSGLFWLLPAFLLPCAAAWRLARFNLDGGPAHHFSGMPVPAAGILVASLPLIYWNINEPWVPELLQNRWFLYALILAVSWLMVSRLPLMSFKFRDYGIAGNWPRYLLLLAAIVSFLFISWLAIPLTILLYVILSLIFKNQMK
jgi:CDP-diacylglycerol--serine O-phosphatidyltransferase